MSAVENNFYFKSLFVQKIKNIILSANSKSVDNEENSKNNQ